ncbi:hypothetical protein [Actinophytocola glycyrrhizae]|uniref:Uncharacterized protein n=1 Tax=Actinophytocola glycyrrhizae TaxID=2044873 RepID=A0ABV9SAV5_9PSEU
MSTEVGSAVDRGTTADALRFELNTGNALGTGSVKWHYQKAVDQFNRLSEWLDDVRKGNIVAGDADITVAKTEAGDLWDTLNTSDRTGNVVADIKAKDASGNRHFRNTLKKATGRAAVSYLTAAEFDYDARGEPTQKGPAKFTARGFIAVDLLGFGVNVRNGGVGDAVFDLFDVTGIGRQYLGMPQCPPSGCVA